MIHALCSASNLRARAEKIKKPLFKQTHKVTFHIITSLGVVFSLSTLISKLSRAKIIGSFSRDTSCTRTYTYEIYFQSGLRWKNCNRSIIHLSSCESFLKCGTILPRFQELGTSLELIIVFIKWLKGCVIDGIDAFRAHGVMWSWPLALFAFIFSRADLTSSWLVKLKSNCLWSQYFGIFETCGWFSKVV